MKLEKYLKSPKDWMKLNGKQLVDLVSCALTMNQQNASPYKWEERNANSNFHRPPQLIFFKNLTGCNSKTCWKIYIFGGFPGGAVVESLPANAGDTGSSPGLGGSHVPRSNWPREPQLLSLRVWSLCSATREAAMVRGPRTAMRSGPRLPQLEKALAQKRKKPNAAKNK